MGKNAPFVPMDPRWWADIARALVASGQPWPREAVLMDLRWWADQERRGRVDGGKPVVRPGRPTLERRWNWSGRQARNILKAEAEWSDPLRRGGDQDAASERPASDQDAASERPIFAAQALEIPRGAASERTGGGQVADSERTESGPTRDLYTQSTVHGSRSTPPSPNGDCPPTGQGDEGRDEGGAHHMHGRTTCTPQTTEGTGQEAAPVRVPRTLRLAQSAAAGTEAPAQAKGTSAFFDGAGRPKPQRARGANLSEFISPAMNEPDVVRGVPVFRDVNHAARTTRKGTPDNRVLAQAWLLWRGSKVGEVVEAPPEAEALVQKYAERWEQHGAR